MRTGALAGFAMLGGALLAPGGAAAADDAALARCAAMADATARLACYDTLAGRPAEPAAAPVAPAPMPVTPAPTAAPAAAPLATADVESFGKPPPKPPEESMRLNARIVGPLKSWRRGTLFRLDNGQVWKAVGDESAYYPDIADDPEVTITQTFFGAYWMEVRQISRKIKVKRVS